MYEDYEFLMSVYNDIEAENVIGVLEIEGIDAKGEYPGNMDIMNAVTDSSFAVNIYVPRHALEEAKRVIEVEMVRGDL